MKITNVRFRGYQVALIGKPEPDTVEDFERFIGAVLIKLEEKLAEKEDVQAG